MWETNKHRRSSENTFEANNLTVLHKPVQDRVMLATLFNETGTLGNCLFKFALIYGIAKDNELIPQILGSTNLKTVFENITPNIPISQKGVRYNESLIKHVKEPNGYAVFHPDVFDLRKIFKKTDVIKVGGYRQSWKYFSHTWNNDLENRLKLSSPIQSKINHYLHSVLSDKSDDTSLVGIHIRRGDFKKLADHGYTVSNITYIENAMKLYFMA